MTGDLALAVGAMIGFLLSLVVLALIDFLLGRRS